jgi:hypothetical protein
MNRTITLIVNGDPRTLTIDAELRKHPLPTEEQVHGAGLLITVTGEIAASIPRTTGGSWPGSVRQDRDADVLGGHDFTVHG